jgi:hypothetical protein
VTTVGSVGALAASRPAAHCYVADNRRMKRLLPWIALEAIVIGFANFLWVWVESATIGDALQGRVEDGHSLLVNKGTATEVSREAREWSRAHTISLFLTHPLAIGGGVYLFLTTWPQVVGVSLAELQERVARIQASGELIASERIGARIGSMQFLRQSSEPRSDPAE